MRFPQRRAGALLAIVLAVAVSGAGCSGGGGGGGGAQSLFTVTNIQIVTANNDPNAPAGADLEGSGTVCISFRVNGPANQLFDLLTEYRLLNPANVPAIVPISGAAMASPVPAVVANQFNIPPSNTQNQPHTIPAQGFINLVFYWCAGCDLAGETDVQFLLTASSMGGVPGVGQSAAFRAGGVIPSVQSGGTGASAGNTPGNPGGSMSNSGRGSHSAHNLGSTTQGALTFKELLVAGGYNGSTSPNAFSSVDRFSIDAANYQIPNAPASLFFQAGQQRVLHASSFYLDPSDKSVKVFVCGGVNDCTPGPINPAGPYGLMQQVAGATAEYASADVYCFTPTEQIAAPMGMPAVMPEPRFGHTATWTANNDVIVIGGATGLANPMALPSILHWNVVSQSFSVATFGGNAVALQFPRAGHSASMLPNGNILIYGGHDPQNVGASMPAEIYNPQTGALTIVPSGMDNRSAHCASRLANGWILITGGQTHATGTPAGTGAPLALASARVYKPEQGQFGNFINMDRARYLHTHTLLGNGNVLVAGGVTGQAGTETFTTNCQVFFPSSESFTSVSSLAEARAEHSATAVDCGQVVVLGGRNAVGAPNNWLDSIEVLPFSNTVPVLFTCATQPGSSAGSLGITATVTDNNADGGYVVIRYRPTNTTNWRHANIVNQIPTTASSATVANFPTMQVDVNRNGGQYLFVWDFASQGQSTGQQVDIQIIPFGASLGSPRVLTGITLP